MGNQQPSLSSLNGERKVQRLERNLVGASVPKWKASSKTSLEVFFYYVDGDIV